MDRAYRQSTRSRRELRMDAGREGLPVSRAELGLDDGPTKLDAWRLDDCASPTLDRATRRLHELGDAPDDVAAAYALVLEGERALHEPYALLESWLREVGEPADDDDDWDDPRPYWAQHKEEDEQEFAR